MKILVTGANGYLGQGIVKAILDSGHEVIAADFKVDHVDDRARKKACNLFDVESPYTFFGRPDVLLHLAWRDGFVHCFDGVVRALGIYSDRGAGKTTKADYFDRDFNWLDLKWGYEHAIERPEKPSLYDKMIEIAESLSQGFPEVRVDLYLCNNRIYFGELTFFDGGGFDGFEPDCWDEVFGSWIALKNRKY